MVFRGEVHGAMTRAKRKKSVLSEWLDWIAVWMAFTSFIFLVAWQSWPDSDYVDEVLPIFIRTTLVATPLTLGMWGVSRAARTGSSVPKTMAQKIPMAQMGSDGSIGGTTLKDMEAGTDPTPIAQNTPDGTPQNASD